MKKLIVPIVIGFLLLLLGRTSGVFAQQKDTGELDKEEIREEIANAGNDSTEAYWRTKLGHKLFSEKKYDDAIVMFNKSLAYQEQANNMNAIAKAKSNIATCYSGKLDMQSALRYYEEAKIAAEKEGNKQTLSFVYKGLISTSNSMGNTAKGLEYAQQLLKLGQAEKDNSLIGLGYYNIGYFYHLNNNPRNAERNYTTALQYYQLAHDTTMIARLQINIGEYYTVINELDSAKAYYTRSLETSMRLGDKEIIASLYERLGNLYAAEGDYVKHLNHVEKSLSLAREIGNKKLTAYYGFSLERANFAKLMSEVKFVNNKATMLAPQQKELQDIMKRTEENVNDYRNSTLNYMDLSTMTGVLSGMKQVAGDYEGALESYIEYRAYRDSFSSAENMKQFASVEAKYAFEKSRDSLRLIDEQKRLELQKEMELTALKFEFEKKQALAKTETERKQLLFEEDVKRRAIEAEYVRNRDAANGKYAQEKTLAKVNEEKERALSLAELRKSNNTRNISLLGAGLLLVSAAVFGYGYSQKRKDNKAIASEKKRSDELLLNILPAEIAEELKNNGQSKAQQHSEVSVLFTDFVNFTQTSEKLGVEELVNELNVNFTAFDNIMERHGLEKIKTIGDAYLAVSGLPIANSTHAQNAVNAALDIIKFVEKRKKEVPYGLDIRIGINSGALIAGIIGVKKFAYDIWGDSVNIAARMEQSGAPGKVNISESTYLLVKKHFECVHRGKIDAKNKGEMDMYFVNPTSLR